MSREKRIRAFLVSSALMALAASGCSSMKIQKDRVASIHKVAVVGFAVEQRMPNTAGGVLKSMMGPDESIGGMALFPAEIAKPASHADEMYRSLEKRLAQGLSWRLLADKELLAQPVYQKLYAERTKQPQSRPMLSGRNMEVFVPNGVIETFLLKTMSLEDRRKLLQGLGVDAIAMATLRVELINGGGLKNLVGAGEFHPSANVSFELYDGNQEDPIWMDLNAKSEGTEPGVEHALGFADVNALNKQAVKVADAAFQELINRYKSN